MSGLESTKLQGLNRDFYRVIIPRSSIDLKYYGNEYIIADEKCKVWAYSEHLKAVYELKPAVKDSSIFDNVQSITLPNMRQILQLQRNIRTPGQGKGCRIITLMHESKKFLK